MWRGGGTLFGIAARLGISKVSCTVTGPKVPTGTTPVKLPLTKEVIYMTDTPIDEEGKQYWLSD